MIWKMGITQTTAQRGMLMCYYGNDDILAVHLWCSGFLYPGRWLIYLSNTWPVSMAQQPTSHWGCLIKGHKSLFRSLGPGGCLYLAVDAFPFVLRTFWSMRAWESEFAPSWFASGTIGFADMVQLPISKALLAGRSNEVTKAHTCA